MKEKKTIANRMKAIRKTLELTQSELAKKINVSITAICEIEKGKYKPNCDFLVNLYQAFNVNLFWLLFGEGEMFFDPTTVLISKSRQYAAKLEDIHNFLWYFQRSAIVQHSTMAHFYGLLVQKKNIIDEEIHEYNEKKLLF